MSKNTDEKNDLKSFFKKEDTLFNRLLNFQGEEIVIEKNKTAGRGDFAYKYSSLDSIIDSIKPYLKKHGIVFYSNLNKNELLTVVCSSDDKNDNISSITELKDISFKGMNDLQGLGAQITYLKRYHLCMLLGLTAEEDTDAQNDKDRNQEKQNKKESSFIEIYKRNIQAGKSKDLILQSFNATKSKMTEEEVVTIEGLINEMK